jgi:hypothetical protein
MNKIDQISNNVLQSHTVVLADGSQFTIQFYFISMQYGWFINYLEYKNFSLKGLRVTNSPNMLHQFRNKIPFGLACISKEDREPSFIDDFSSGASSIYLLTSEEVAKYEEYLSGQI